MKDGSKKKISLALQGGGSHGAYTWGVLDALFEDGRIDIDGLCGTSAGGMNATAAAMGWIEGGPEGARKMMRTLWEKIGESSLKSPIRVGPLQKAQHDYSLSNNPIFMAMQYMSTILSPYQLNPQNVHPLQETVRSLFDFKALQKSQYPKLFLCATHVASGKLKVFSNKELSEEAVLASACVPTLFQAREVDGEFYWDGGFIGNPAIYPLIYNCDATDILIIQIRRVHDEVIPKTAHDIANRLGEITQNSCLTREMRAINFLTNLIDDGTIPKGKLKRLNMHMIRDDEFFGAQDRTSGFCADPDFLEYLFKAGQKMGKKWLKENFDNIGKKTTAHIEEDFI